MKGTIDSYMLLEKKISDKYIKMIKERRKQLIEYSKESKIPEKLK